jgi:cytochrome c
MAEQARAAGCLACHAVDHRIVGPSLRDVAARYKGDASAEAKLVAKVRQGGSGVWGDVPMPPHPTLDDALARALVGWILGGAL